MTITLPNSRWQLIGGLPVLLEGDCCVVAHREPDAAEGFCTCYENGLGVDYECPECPPFSLEHFATAEKLLDDYLSKKREQSVTEVFRSEYGTVFQRDDGLGVVVWRAIDNCGWNYFLTSDHWRWNSTREQAESNARKALMEGK